jgi:regulatory protein
MSASVFLAKALRYCAAQERCTSEVREKLIAWGEDALRQAHGALRQAQGDSVDAILARLVKDGYLNEQRFAEHYAVSKFRQKGWGRVKIRAALRFKQVEAAIIASGLAAIDEDEYNAALREALRKRMKIEKGRDAFEREQRVKRYLMGKGFEGELIEGCLKD